MTRTLIKFPQNYREITLSTQPQWARKFFGYDFSDFFTFNLTLQRATDSCDASQVKKLIYWINKIGKAGSKNFSIHINTGTHGDGKGNTIHDMPLSQKHAEIKFSEEDLSNVLHLNNVSLHTITTTTPPQYPRAAAHVIDAWCSSSNNGDAQVCQDLFILEPV